MIRVLAASVLVILLAIFCNGAPQLRIFKNTPENIARLRNLKPGELAEELSGQFEGDMILTEGQYVKLSRRNGMIDESFRWPLNTVFYEIQEFWYTEEQLQYILEGMRTIEEATCVRFLPRGPSNQDYVLINGWDWGCSSSVGRIGGVQIINLQPYRVGTGCFQLGTIVHELIHSLGFWHMHSTYNRDDYVEIVWENIQAGSEKNFRLHDSDSVSNFGTIYDYGSVMHYSSTAFSINGEETIVARYKTNDVMGQREGMSQTDIFKINRMYKC